LWETRLAAGLLLLRWCGVPPGALESDVRQRNVLVGKVVPRQPTRELHLLAFLAEVHRRHWLSGDGCRSIVGPNRTGGNRLVGFRDNAGAGTIEVSGRKWGTGCRIGREQHRRWSAGTAS
jgi:hypothetical protein